MSRLLALVCLLAGAAATLGAAPSVAAVSCTFAAPKVTVSMTYNGDTATFTRSGSAILVNGSSCGPVGNPATVANTDSVRVNGALGKQTVTIDKSAGAFAPGATLELTGVSEIEFTISLSDGTDVFAFQGGSSNDSITLGTAGMNVNGDDDADVTTTRVERVTARGGAGSDKITAAGGLGTGSPYALNFTAYGGDGVDTITGGNGNDPLLGETGNDVVTGGEGDDRLDGGPGADKLYGLDGNDSLEGGPDNDVEVGGLDNDIFVQTVPAGMTSCSPDGPDSIFGNEGVDEIRYFCRSSALAISLDNVANDGATAVEGDNVRSTVERVFGGSAGDVLTGSAGDNFLYGGSGNDVIDGAAGEDELRGADGNDTITGGDGEDFMYGDLGSDSFHALDGGWDSVDGGVGPVIDFDIVLDKDSFDTIANVP